MLTITGRVLYTRCREQIFWQNFFWGGGYDQCHTWCHISIDLFKRIFSLFSLLFFYFIAGGTGCFLCVRHYSWPSTLVPHSWLHDLWGGVPPVQPDRHRVQRLPATEDDIWELHEIPQGGYNTRWDNARRMEGKKEGMMDRWKNRWTSRLAIDR